MTKKNENMTPDDYRDSLMEAMLGHVAFDGWSDKSMKMAAEDLGIDPGIAQLAFPDGPVGVIDLVAQKCDLAMLEIIKDKNFHDLKIREKITKLVRVRIEHEVAHKEAANAAVPFLALPQNHMRGLKILYRTVDLMWKAIDDKSTDFNYYTKRMTLSAVYSSTLVYWLNDDSEDSHDSWDYLDRRIENVMQFEKFKFQNKDKLPDLGKVWRKLGEKRYGS